jgi:hypothetical protein
MFRCVAGDQAHVDLEALRRAHGAHLALLQHAQELHLERDGHVADLVQEERALVRRLEKTLVVAVRARERAFDVSEELGFEKLLGDRAAVDRHERLIAAAARAVDRSRDQLLAGARTRRR